MWAGLVELPRKQQTNLALELDRLEDYSNSWNINEQDEDGVSMNLDLFKQLIELIPPDSIKRVLEAHNIEFKKNWSHSKLKEELFRFIEEIVPNRNNNVTEQESIPFE